MKKSLKKMLPLTTSVFLCLGMFALTPTATVASQGAQSMLYTVPNSTFIENPSGDSKVTVNDTSGSISTLQTSINNARSAHPSSIIVITLKSGATYTVSSAGLTLGSDECLIASGATIKASSSSVTVPLITISSGSQNVSVAGGTLDGNGANIQAIYAPSAARVNVDAVVAKNCGQDCIVLYGQGNTTYDNEMTVTRCDVSGSAAHAGISIHSATQAAILDNNCHNNSAGIYLSCAWANVANNTCQNNTTGIDVAGGNDNVVANNTCNNNTTGIHVAGSKNMITGNSVGANTTAGIASAGSTDYFLYNSFGSGNGANFSSGGTSDGIIAWKTSLSASGQNYFYPPLIDNQHSTTIVNGKGRTDVTISSTSIASVQSQYNSARSSNPNNVIVLHLNGTFTVGSAPLTLQSDTCVLLNGTIQINSSTTAAAAIVTGSSATRISISGGTIDSGSLTGHEGIDMTNNNSMICIDKVTLQNFGDNAASHPGSDAIHFSGGSSPSMVTRCTINKAGSRGIWAGTSNQKILYQDNYVTQTRAGLDCDYHTFGALAMFNTFVNNTYGLWYEQGAQHNTGIGNVVTNSDRDNLDAGNLNQSQITEYNNFLCNFAEGRGNGLINSAGSDGNTFTSHNFFFNNYILNASITSSGAGTENYYSQTYQSGGSFTSSSAATYFNSPDVTGTPDFSLSASPDSLTIAQGNNDTSTITVDPVFGFSGSVSLSASGLPAGVTASFNPSSTTSTSTLTLTASGSATTGTATVTITGTSGSLQHTTTISLTVNSAGGPLPGGWTGTDIGAVGIAGSASYNNGTFTVSGSGADIWNAADQFNYAYQSVSGDTTAIARVVSENGTASYAKAGVMIRESLATNSVEASVLLTPTNGVAMEIRPTTGAISINVAGWITGVTPPQWVKLVRSGNTFTGYYSADGSTWTQIAATNVTMNSSAIAGLAVTSHDNNSLNTATFDNVSIGNSSGGGIDTTAIYQIQNEASGMVLNNQGRLTNGSAITQWQSISSDNLRWTFIPTDSGYYQINSVKSGLDAVVQSASTAQGAGIIQWSFGAAQNDQWLPQQNSDGSFTFVNRHSGLVLEDPGSSTSTSTQMDQWGANGGSNQKWQLIKQ